MTKGRDVRLKLRSQFLKDLVAGSRTAMVRIGLIDEFSPLLVEGTDGWLSGVAMPMRLN